MDFQLDWSSLYEALCKIVRQLLAFGIGRGRECLNIQKKCLVTPCRPAVKSEKHFLRAEVQTSETFLKINIFLSAK